MTAVTDIKGRIHLFGFGNVTYDSREVQNESLWNPSHLRKQGVRVEDKAKRDGGDQHIQLRVEGKTHTFDLDFDGTIMTMDIREPTEEEIATLGVVWLMPPIVKHTHTIRRHTTESSSNEDESTPEETTVSGETSTQEVESSVPDKASAPENEEKKDMVSQEEDTDLEFWKECLGHPSDEVVKRTLENTTQYCAEPVEMEKRELPRQHRKKRLPPLHPRRLPGVTATDTFFSSVKSIRNHTCVQLFVHVPSDYLFVRCMQRERHSHGAFQDFIREMGAPNVIVSDNSKTQTGNDWRKTSRLFVIKQRTFAPHNQQQNKAERRIQDVKHKVMYAMYQSKAPLEFWCYALIFIVDCLNHIAKKPLGWRTSEELLNGDTPDISPFRFKFWERIEYYEPTARYPESPWREGNFVGIVGKVVICSRSKFGYLILLMRRRQERRSLAIL